MFKAKLKAANKYLNTVQQRLVKNKEKIEKNKNLLF